MRRRQLQLLHSPHSGHGSCTNLPIPPPLPPLCRGTLWFDCADYWQVQAITQSDAYATMVAELCPTRAGTWDECAPRGNETDATTRPFRWASRTIALC